METGLNDLHQMLRTRRSIRRFKPDPVPAPLVDSILRTTTFAPSAHNLQPWRFGQIKSMGAREKLGKALTEKMRTDMEAEGSPQAEIQERIQRSLNRIAEAPVIILLCRDKTAIRKNDAEEHHMSIQSTALAGLQLTLAAHAEGLCANWICWALYAQAETQKALNLPQNWLPEALFFIGYPNETPNEKILQPIEKISKQV